MWIGWGGRGAGAGLTVTDTRAGFLGVSVLETVLKMDAGPVLATVTLGADDARVTDAPADKLLEDPFELGTDALIDVLRRRLRTLPRGDERKQDRILS